MQLASISPRVHRDTCLQVLSVFLIVVGLATIAGYVAWRLSSTAGDSRFSHGLLLAIPIFLMSQILRSLRLFFLCYDQRIHFGTVIAVHFLSAPVTALIPWKLGEIYRILLLGRFLRDGTRALVAIWTERVHDIVMVAFFLIALALTAGTGIGGYTFFLLLALAFLFLSFFVFAVMPENLGRFKRYLFLRWHDPRSLRLIAVVDRFHELFIRAGQMWRSHWATVAWLTVAIWVLEIAWVATVIAGSGGSDLSMAEDVMRAFEALTLKTLAWSDEAVGLSSQALAAIRLVLVDLAVVLALPAAWLLARSGLGGSGILRRRPA